MAATPQVSTHRELSSVYDAAEARTALYNNTPVTSTEIGDF